MSSPETIPPPTSGADTAYRSQTKEAWLKRQSRVSRILRKKPRGKLMPERTARSNAAKSKLRARVEPASARQKDQIRLFVRTIGIKRAEAKITLADMAYDMHRLIFLERRATMGWVRPETSQITVEGTLSRPRDPSWVPNPAPSA